MSTPFINPYEVKDVVSTSLNNLDKQSQDLISYLDGLFSSETIKDKQLILDDGTVETLKPFEVANSQGAFWDKGTTYYFQPIADRLREISLEIQGRLNSTEVTDTLKAGLAGLFSDTLNDSRTQVSNDSTEQYANTWTYEQWYKEIIPSATNPIGYTDINAFLNAVGTAAFKMADASSDEETSTKAIDYSTLQFDINLQGIAELLDDGDNYYNDNPTIDDPSTPANEGQYDTYKQPEFYIIGNTKLPVFGAVENAPNSTTYTPPGVNNPDYKRDLYNYQNKRIDPNSIYWNDPNPSARKKSEEVFYDMVAIAITKQKVSGPINSANPDQVRLINAQTAENARRSLEKIAGAYFQDTKAWYDSTAPRNLDPAILPTPPSFLLSKSTNGTIDYSAHDSSYGAFKDTDLGTLASLISDATGISIADVNSTITNWNTTANPALVERITKYYTQSYISSSITPTFGQKDSAISTKSFFIHEALNNLDPLKNPYLEEAGDIDIIKFDTLLAAVPSGYLRSPENTATTHISTQMMQLMDLFLEDFDIGANRYVEDKRTLVDLFSGKLLKTTGENAEVQKSLFQNMRASASDIASQIKNTLTRGIPESAESQFTLDLFSQTAVRKEDYGLSPNPADPSEHFLPSSWANNKDKYLPAMYYYNPANLTPTSGSDEANNTLNGTAAKNGLPAGFPIMDVRDFDQFFKATKLALTDHIMDYLNANLPLVTANNLTSLYNEMGAFLTDPSVLGTYPSWTDAGFATGSATAIFGTLDLAPASDKTNFSRAVQLYKSLDNIINNMEDRVSSFELSVPKIPRPAASPLLSPGTLQSSITGYGDKPSPALVKSFLEMHEDTKGPTVSVDADAESLQRISYLINTFDDYSKFSQNSAFEGIYAGEVFEADKQNYTSINAKKPDPGPDGSMPEEKDVPKPLMAALSSSILVSKMGQVLVNKVNDLVAKNDIVSINNVDRGGTDIGSINMTGTGLSGSKESQTYLTNILKQIPTISAGSSSVDFSIIGNLISDKVETAMQTLITSTDVDAYRTVFIDDVTLTELITLEAKLNSFSPTGTLLTLKNLLTAANLSGLKTAAYPAVNPTNTNNAPGYLPFNLLTTEQQNLINDIRDGKFAINGSTSTYTLNGVAYTLPTNIVPVDIPDNILNTLGTLAANITTMLNASLTEQPPRVVNVTTDPILSEINNAKLNFTALTAPVGSAVSYNAILDADVYEVGPPVSTVTMASLLAGTPADILKANNTIQARKDLLAGLLQNTNKEVGGKLIDNLDKSDPLNPYRNLLAPNDYGVLDSGNLTPQLPYNLAGIPNVNKFQAQINNIEIFIQGVQASLTAAISETPPRVITVADDPILLLNTLAQLDFADLKDTTSSVWTGITDPLDATKRNTIMQRLIESNVGAVPLLGHPDEEGIRTARENLLGFFLESKLLDPTKSDSQDNYAIASMPTHERYKHLISPVTYAYPSGDITYLDDLTASTAPLALGSTVDNSKADSFTLREVMGCDKDFTGGDVPFRDNSGNYLNSLGNISAIPDNTLGFPNSLNDLEFKMKNVTGEFTVANKQLYVRKMQHFNVLFNTLSGGTTKNPPLASFGIPPALFGTPPTQNLKQYIESLANDTSIINLPAFQNIVDAVEQLAPITENINALEVSLANEIRKPKTGPESEIYSTLHLFTQIENQTAAPDDLEAGLLQIFNKRKIKDDTKATPIIDLDRGAPPTIPLNAAAIALKNGLYQYSGYDANKNYLKPTNSPSISGRNIAPDTSTYPNEGWDIEQLLTTKGIASGDFPPFTTVGTVSGLTKARDFLVALNEVYKDMQASKSPVIKEQLKVFDLWLKNNSFSTINDGALGGKDSLEADINILDHIQEGGGMDPSTINTFLTASKAALAINKSKLENLDDLRTSGKGLGQRIDENLSASALEDYFHQNIFYPTNLAFPDAGVQDTRTVYTKDLFGRDLTNTNLPVFGVNIFGEDPKTGITYNDPITLPATPSPISSNSYKNFGLTGVSNLANPHQKIMENINTLLTRLKMAETAGYPNEQSLYKTMIKNLLGESGEAPSADLINAALAENPASYIPGHPSLVDATMGLTYSTNNYPNTSLRSEILTERRSIADTIDPAKYTGSQPIPNATLANFTLSSKADQATTVRTVGVEGKSIQELAILLYIMQMFESSNWDFEKYINDTSRYEMVDAVE
jgi:hypothetical protein